MLMGTLRFFHIKCRCPTLPDCGILLASENRRRAVAFISIGSFFVIFLVAILWATRPENKRDAQEHGTKEQNESVLLSR
jgi:hypothetical protein